MKKITQILFITLALALGSCADKKNSLSSTGVGAASGQTVSGQERIAVSNAEVDQCAAGGYVYSIYLDINSNKIQDIDESSLSTQTVCNGTSGANGYSSLFSMSRATIDANICSSGSGIQLSSGLDLNRSGYLNASEIIETQFLCDGKNGAAGAAGPAGSNGHSVVFQVTNASTSVCSNGGSIIAMALDINDRGTYSSSDPNQQSMILCNGLNGVNASAGSYTPMEIIMPCGNTSLYKEVLFRLNNGQVLGAFSDDTNGKNTRLSLLVDGSYMTTDGTKCTFSLETSQDKKTRSISWLGKVQSTWIINNY